MGSIISIGDAFIWITSIAGGLLLTFAAYRAILSRSLSAEGKALLGEWFGYAYFHAKDGDRFYKERLTIRRGRWRPWHLQIEAEPIPSAGETIYRGRIIIKSSIIYCEMYEPVYSDKTYEIAYRPMDHDSHSGRIVVGLNMGNSYDKSVYSANAYVWTRDEFDPKASPRQPPTDIEKDRFLAIASQYFEISAEGLQLKLFIR